MPDVLTRPITRPLSKPMPTAQAQGIVDVFGADADQEPKPLTRPLTRPLAKPKEGVVAELGRRESETLGKYGGYIKESLTRPLTEKGNIVARIGEVGGRIGGAIGDVAAGVTSPAEAGVKTALSRTIPDRFKGEEREKKVQDIGDVTTAALLAPSALGKTGTTARAIGGAREIVPGVKDAEAVHMPAIQNGKQVFTGKDHATIRAENETLKGGKEGFVTNTGRFISREEAEPMAQAKGQFKGERNEPGKLHSEELKNPAPLAAPAGQPGIASRVADDFRRIFAPANRGEIAAKTGGNVRENLAKQEQRYQQAANNLRQYSKAVGQLPEEARYDFIDKIETGKIDALHPELKPVGQEIRRLFDERYAKIKAMGKNEHIRYVQNYFPHIWKDPKAAEAAYSGVIGKRPLEGSKAFTKGRVIDSVATGREAGLELVTDNPIELSLLKLREMDKFITAHDIFGEMKAGGLAKFFKVGDKRPEGWAKIDDKIAQVYSRGEKGELIKRGEYHAPQQAATIVNNYLSPGLSGKPIYDVLHGTANSMNQIQLGLSGFHAAFVAIDSMTSGVATGIKQISRGEAGRGLAQVAKSITPAKPVMTYLKGRKLLMQYLGRGQYGKEMESIVDGLLKGGGRVTMDSFYRNSAAGSFWNAIRRGTVAMEAKDTLRQSGALLGSGKILLRAFDTVAAPLMENIVPRMKLGVFFEMMQDELRVNPAMSAAQKREVAGRLWNSVDNRLGQLVYDNLFWNKTLKDLAHISVRSVGWNLGTIRELGGGILDVGKTAKSAVKGDYKSVTDRTAYVIAMPMVTALYGAMYQYVKTGQSPQELTDYLFPKTGGKDNKGNPIRVSIPGYMKDVYEYRHDPYGTLKSKINPIWAVLDQMLNNKDFYGAPIHNPNDPWVQQVGQVGEYMAQQYVPFTLRPQSSTVKNSNLNAFERAMSLHPAPYFIRNPEGEQRYKDYEMNKALAKKKQREAQ